jgi:DNA-binding protein YbaB
MFKPPQDLFERSKSTQIQWLIMLVIYLIFSIYLTVAGVIFITNALDITSYNLMDAFWISIGIGAGISIFTSLNFKKDMRLNSKMDRMIKETRERLEEDIANKTKEDGILRKIIEINYMGKTKFILIEIDTYGEKPDPEEEKRLFEEVVDDAFAGFVISAEAKKQNQE